MTLRYLLDEHVSLLYQKRLRQRAPDLEVWSIGDPGAPARGTLDPAILDWCETNNFILVTNNRKSMPGHLADRISRGRHVPGIFVLGERLTIGEVIEELFLIALASESDQYQDLIMFLPITRRS